ncbi:MAG TPA: VCBS repeat-containing protein, partial [Planctomycetota bacterium]
MARGDVDGDGDLDLVFGIYGQDRLYLNDGAGTFTDATTARMPVDNDFTMAVALGDVDGDGDLDLVLGNGSYFSSGEQNRLCLNNGSGTFTDATATRMPVDNDRTACVALGDVDGDGDLDIVFGNPWTPSASEQNRLYLNNGTGTFSDVTTTSMPVNNDSTLAVALGDVDGDGDLDLVFGNSFQQNRLYLNNGTGTFTDVTTARMPVDGDNSRAAVIGDVDGDSDLDLVFGNDGQQSRLYLNNGAGAFTDATAARMPVGNFAATCSALGDVDSDGDLDLVFGVWGQNRLYANNGTGTFTDATTARMPADNDNTRAMVIGDVDGDSDLDLVFGNWLSQNRLYLNNGSGSFDATAPTMAVNSDDTRALAMGDVDGDGDLDLVFGNTPNGIAGQNCLYLNNGLGTFTDVTATRMPIDNDPTTSVALGDVDGDGDLDLVFGTAPNPFSSVGQNRLYLNNGAGTFGDVTATLMPADNDLTTCVAIGDVDGDGDRDLVFGNSGYPAGQQNRLYLNDGTGSFTDATAARMPLDNDPTSCVALGDVDADGDLDLVFGNNGQQNRLYLNNGSGTFSDATAASLPVGYAYATCVALGDVNGDGDLDLVFGNNGQNRLYLNNGTGTFTDATAARMPASAYKTTSVALGDVDGDRDLDLVFGNWNQQNRLCLNNGTGTFTDATVRMPVDSDLTTCVALGDLDRDGDLDAVFGMGNARLDRLYVNLLRQLDSPGLLRVGRTYQLDVYARYGPPRLVDVALPYLSTGIASIPLPPLGTLGIDPNGLIQLPAFVIQPGAGVGQVAITVPNIPGLAGIAIYGQALLIQYPTQDRLTNV